MGNDPVNGVDPDGGKKFDQGINRKGDIVFDNGNNNGNVFLVNDGYTEKITSLDQLKANSSQLTSNWKWIGTELQMKDFIQSQLSFANASFTKVDIVQSFNEYEKPANAMEAQMGSLQFKDGKIIATPLGKGRGGLTVKNIPGSSNLILGDVYNVRSTLEHESRHQIQITRVTTFNKYKDYKYFIENDAVNSQMKGKWFNKSSIKYQNQVKAYPSQFK